MILSKTEQANQNLSFMINLKHGVKNYRIRVFDNKHTQMHKITFCTKSGNSNISANHGYPLSDCEFAIA